MKGGNRCWFNETTSLTEEKGCHCFSRLSSGGEAVTGSGRPRDRLETFKLRLAEGGHHEGE